MSTFTWQSGTDEVIAGIDLHGLSALVTGGSLGIGAETARALAQAGAAVTIAGRNVKSGTAAAARISAATGNPNVRALALDLADPAQVARFGADWSGPLNIMVANAGVLLPDLQHTADGWETMLAVNHRGHFALAHALLPAMRAANGARIVVVSSSGHLAAPVIFDDLHFRYRMFDWQAAYGQSKTANVLFCVASSAHWAEDGVIANAQSPGFVRETAFSRHLTPEAVALMAQAGLGAPPPEVLKTLSQGAATSVYLATSPEVAGSGGRYYESCAPAPLSEGRGSGFYTGVAPFALDEDNAERLWQVSLAAIDR